MKSGECELDRETERINEVVSVVEEGGLAEGDQSEDD